MPTRSSRTAVPDQCRICFSPAPFAFLFKSYAVHRCGSCGVEFLDPQPTDETLASIYTADYVSGKATAVDQGLLYFDLKLRSARRSLALIEKFGGPTSGSLLEIGTGTGAFLVEAEKKGYTCLGIEFSQSAASVSASRLSSGRVMVGTLESAGLEAASFDVVANSDVIEHVRDPVAFAQEMRRVLRPGGVAFITTPSLDSLSRLIMGRQWIEYKVEHLFYFNRKALAKMLKQVGFTKIEIVPDIKTLSCSYINVHFEKYPSLFSFGVRTVAHALPTRLANLPIDVVASGITAIAS